MYFIIDNSRNSLRNLLVSRRCLLCHAPLATGDRQLCVGCHADLPWLTRACPGCALPRPDNSLCPDCARHPPLQSRACAAFRFEGPVRQAVLGLKYGAGFAQAHWLGHALAQSVSTDTDMPPDILLPVPLHHLRLRKRGYNQALELARIVGRELKIQVDWHSLQRTRVTADQIGQSRAARRRNLRGAFAASPQLKGMHVAILDDVMTTGSTLAELARCCRRVGAETVEVWAIARA